MSYHTIHRNEIEWTGLTTVELNKGSVLIDFEVKGDKPCVWHMVPINENETEKISYIIVGTGSEFDTDDYCYLDTCHQVGSIAPFLETHYVWHLLERI